MPYHDLVKAKQAAEAGHVEAAMGSALRKYQEVMGYTMADKKKIHREIQEGIARLEARNFSESVEIVDEETGEMVWYDVYALLDYRGWDWYVKFCISDDGWVFNLSFHLPVRPMKAKATGQVICHDAITQRRLNEV